MQINKRIIEKLRKNPINGRGWQTKIANYCGVSSSYINAALKKGECSEAVYNKILDYLEENEVNPIQKREQRILKSK